MLYKLVDGKDCFELNPELLAIPEFAKLTDKQFKVVALVADRRSPLRTLPEKQRREKACAVAGYGKEENRPAKNARVIIAGGVESIEKAIEKYREYQYDDNAENLDAINKQIQEIRDYLQSDKAEYLLSNGKIVLDKNGDEVKFIDPKTLKLASDLGEKLPGLIEAKQKLEALLQVPTDQKPELLTYTSADLPDEAFEVGAEELPSIERWHQAKPNRNNPNDPRATN